MAIRQSIADRFRSKVNVRGPDDCWPWMAGCFPDGYGAFWANGRTGRAHRASWTLSNGPIPDDLMVCHSCDIRYPPHSLEYRRCCNLRHLWLGTARDNVDDMISKGRRGKLRGEGNGQAKLAEKDILAIREDHRILKLVAAEYGVSCMTISLIRRMKRWRHVT